MKLRCIKGFTLFECLCALLIAGLVCLLLAGMMSQLKISHRQLGKRHSREFEVFMLQLPQVLAGCQEPVLLSNGIEFKKKSIQNGNEMMIAVRLRYRHLSKRVFKNENGGNEMLLTEVKAFRCNIAPEGVKLVVEFLDGTKKAGWLLT